MEMPGPEGINMKNIKPPRKKRDVLSDNQSIKSFCDQVQSLRETINILEQRFTILEETLDRIRRGA